MSPADSVVREILRPPNLLTFARMVLTGFIARNLLAQDCRTALILIGVAGVTDATDGYLARAYQWQTRFGAYLDPIADKLLLTVVYVCLAAADLVPVWLVVLIVARDVVILSMVAAAFLFTTIRQFPPSLLGKASTAIQIAVALWVVARCRAMPEWLLMLTAAVTGVSGIHYLWRGYRLWPRRS